MCFIAFDLRTDRPIEVIGVLLLLFQPPPSFCCFHWYLFWEITILNWALAWLLCVCFENCEIEFAFLAVGNSFRFAYVSESTRWAVMFCSFSFQITRQAFRLYASSATDEVVLVLHGRVFFLFAWKRRVPFSLYAKCEIACDTS